MLAAYEKKSVTPSLPDLRGFATPGAHEGGQQEVGTEGRWGRGSWSLPEVGEVQLLGAVAVSLALSALASGRLAPASRSGQKGSMVSLQEVGTGSEDSPPHLGGLALHQCGGRGKTGAPGGRCLSI